MYIFMAYLIKAKNKFAFHLTSMFTIIKLIIHTAIFILLSSSLFISRLHNISFTSWDCLLLNPEDGGDIFTLNIQISLSYIVL